jgi:hypothetical protein
MLAECWRIEKPAITTCVSSFMVDFYKGATLFGKIINATPGHLASASTISLG